MRFTAISLGILLLAEPLGAERAAASPAESLPATPVQALSSKSAPDGAVTKTLPGSAPDTSAGNSDSLVPSTPPPREPLSAFGKGVPEMAGPAFWYNNALSNHLEFLKSGRATNISSAISAYEKASEGDCSPALVNLGYACDMGLGIPRDPSKAIEYYQRASELGNPVAAYNLGLKHYTGTNGLPLDWTAAQRYLTQAAEDGLVAAQHLLGQLRLDQGNGSEALAWFTRSAELGHVPSMYSLGSLLHYGARGVSPDLPKAVQWYQRAASSDFIPAQFQLGLLFDRGPGVQNSLLAETFFRKAANHGHRVAQHMMGEYCYRGRVAAVDLVEAHKWWTLASSAGLEIAAVARRQLEKIIPDEDRARAQRLVAEFKVTPSEYREPGVARIETRSRVEQSSPTTRGSGFVVSDSGHVVACTPRSPDPDNEITVSLMGGRLKGDRLGVEAMLGLSVVKLETSPGTVRPLALQTHRSHVTSGTWVFCALLAPGTSSQENLKQMSLKTRIGRSTGVRADPRQFCLASRLSESFRGAAVLNESGEVLGMVIDPSPEADAVPGAVVIGSRYLRDFLRSRGVTPVLAPEIDQAEHGGESTPLVSPYTGNALVSVTASKTTAKKP